MHQDVKFLKNDSNFMISNVINFDEYLIQPILAESFIINSGGRFDFVLDANRKAVNYWTRGSYCTPRHTIHAV